MAEFSTSIDIEAPPEVVFAYLVNGQRMVAWMGERAELEPTAGGRFAVDINGVPFRGRYLEVEPPRRVVVSWGIQDSDDFAAGSSRVEFTLTPISTGTELRLLHTDLPDRRASTHADGWAHYLERLGLAAGGAQPGADTWTPAGPPPPTNGPSYRASPNQCSHVVRRLDWQPGLRGCERQADPSVVPPSG